MNRWLALLLLVPCVACGLHEGGVPADGGALDATLDSGPLDATDDGAGQDALIGDGGADVALDADAGCPTNLEGPAMLLVDGYCIDQTEVTKTHYDRFLGAVADAGFVPSAACTWNKTLGDLTPSNWDPKVNGLAPVTEVDWCDAYAYCAWAKKRLCGARLGGALGAKVASNDATSQWYSACSRGGTRTYAYGNTWDNTKCRDDNQSGTVADVKSYAQCEGGYSGLFDMTGNASEWIDQCAGPGRGDDCVTQGGNYGSDDKAAKCDAQETATRDHDSADWLGIRCCWP